jgi:hypothetical protein
MNAPIVKISHKSVRATDWTTKSSEFESRYGEECSFLHVFQTGCGRHRTSHLMGNWGSLSEG